VFSEWLPILLLPQTLDNDSDDDDEPMLLFLFFLDDLLPKFNYFSNGLLPNSNKTKKVIIWLIYFL
jgi:hypothetical protein